MFWFNIPRNDKYIFVIQSSGQPHIWEKAALLKNEFVTETHEFVHVTEIISEQRLRKYSHEMRSQSCTYF